MATTTAEPPAGLHTVPPNGKRPVGRPPKAASNGTPPPLIQSGDDESFWEWLDQIPKDQWQYLICYLWRTAPILDLSGGGKPVTVEKIVHAFDSQYILKTHGSGGYRFDISQIPPDGSKQKRIRQSYQMLIDQRYPPKLSYGTWIDDARNADWAWAKPALAEEAARLATGGAPQSQQAQTPAEALVDYLDVANKVKELSGGNENPSLVTAVMKMLEGSQAALRDYQDPVKQMATLKSLMEFAGGAKKEDSSLILILEMMKEQNRDLREELKSMRAQTPTNPLDGVKPVLELLATLGVNLGGGGGAVGKSSMGDTLVATAGDVLTKVIDKASDLAPALIGAYQFGKQKDLEIAAQAQRTGAQQRPWEWPGNKSPATVGNPAVAQQTAPVVPEGPMTPQTFFVRYKELFNEIYPHLLDCYNKRDGYDFQDWFIEGKGLDLWNQIKKDATPELLTQLTQMHPQLKPAWQPEEKVLIFFSQMLDDEGDEDDDEDVPVAQPEVVK